MTTAWDDLAAENAWLRKELEAMSQDILKVQCELAEFQIEYGTPAAMKEYVSGLEQTLAEAKDISRALSNEISLVRDQLAERTRERDEAYGALIARASQGKG